MINETFVASDPKSAYEQAVEKYGEGVTLVSAKQVKYDDGKLRCEVTIAIPADLFLKKSILERKRVTEVEDQTEDEALLVELSELKKQLFFMKAGMLGEDDESGASGLSLGGGTFFTSMEDLTIDAIGRKGNAFVAGVAYNLSSNLLIGGAYGSFIADDKDIFDSIEIDLIAEYTLNEKISVVLAYADIDDKTANDEDYSQLRIIANYNF